MYMYPSTRMLARSRVPHTFTYISFGYDTRDTATRIYSVSRLRRENPCVKISSWAKVMGIAEYFCRPFEYWIFQIWPYPMQNPM